MKVQSIATFAFTYNTGRNITCSAAVILFQEIRQIGVCQNAAILIQNCCMYTHIMIDLFDLTSI